MKTAHDNEIGLPTIVDPAEWQTALGNLTVKEKAATRARDALAAERRRLPMVRIDKPYVFAAPAGEVGLLDLFEGRRQLLLYHFMFAPSVNGWPTAGCPGCSWFVDQIGHLAHLRCAGHDPVLGGPCAFGEHRAIQGPHGMDRSMGLVCRQRL